MHPKEPRFPQLLSRRGRRFQEPHQTELQWAPAPVAERTRHSPPKREIAGSNPAWGADFGDSRLPDRFWDKVSPEPNSGCWLWAAGMCHEYGWFHQKNGTGLAHRVSYVALVGDPGDELVLDHLCRTKHCVNPAHLEPVTSGENVLRGDSLQAKNRDKTHCIRGHEFTEENTRVARRADGGVSRKCRKCNTLRNRAYRAARAEVAR